MRCTAKMKDGADLLAQLRAAQPMPRGERLATWMHTHAPSSAPPRRNTRWWRLWARSFLPADYYGLRAHAAPLALARERRRRERAEAEVRALRAGVPLTVENADRARVAKKDGCIYVRLAFGWQSPSCGNVYLDSQMVGATVLAWRT